MARVEKELEQIRVLAKDDSSAGLHSFALPAIVGH